MNNISLFLSVFLEGIFFIPTLQLAMCRPFGHTQVLRRIIPGMVTLLLHDPIRVHLYRHVIIMMQGDRAMTEIALHNTTQVVTKETDNSTTRVVTNATDQVPGLIPRPSGDLGLVNPSTLAVAITIRHVTTGIDSTMNSKHHPQE